MSATNVSFTTLQFCLPFPLSVARFLVFLEPALSLVYYTRFLKFVLVLFSLGMRCTHTFGAVLAALSTVGQVAAVKRDAGFSLSSTGK